MTQHPNFLHNSLERHKNDYINLLHTGWEKCKPGYSYTNFRNMYLVHFVKSGNGILQTSNKKYHLSANDVFIIRPNCVATYTAANEDPWEYYYFAFNGMFAQELIEHTCFKGDITCVHLSDDKLYHLIQDATLNIKSNSETYIHSLKFFFDFLCCLADEGNNLYQQTNDSISAKKYVSAIQEYITFNYSKDIKISEIADMFNINRSYMYKLFKKETGKSVDEYLVHIRMQKAKQLLWETKFPTTSIAQLIGYSTTPAFFKAFKKYEGITPIQYRKKLPEVSPDSNN